MIRSSAISVHTRTRASKFFLLISGLTESFAAVTGRIGHPVPASSWTFSATLPSANVQVSGLPFQIGSSRAFSISFARSIGKELSRSLVGSAPNVPSGIDCLAVTSSVCSA